MNGTYGAWAADAALHTIGGSPNLDGNTCGNHSGAARYVPARVVVTMPLLPLLRFPTLIAVLVVAAACVVPRHTRETDRSSLLSAQAGPSDRSCRIAEQPTVLPPVDELVDSAALHGAIEPLRNAEGFSPGHVLLSMAYDRFGSNIRRAVIEHTVSQSVADSLQRLIFSHRKTAATGEEWGVRLRIDLTDSLRFRVGRRELCPPMLRNRAIASPLGDIAGGRDRFEPSAGGSGVATGTESTVWVRLLIAPDGSVADARFDRGIPSRIGEERLLNYVRMLDFEPALDDGIPVPDWLDLQLRVPR